MLPASCCRPGQPGGELTGWPERREQPRGPGVDVRAAERDPAVGEVRVEIERAVAGAVRPGAGGGDALARQGSDEVAHGRAASVGHGRDDDLGDTDRPGAVMGDHARCGAEAEPFVRRVVEGERVLRHVGVRRAERPAHHAGGALVHRQRARHVGRETHPQQRVLADRAVHVGAELDPVNPVPQDRLLGHPQPAQAELGDQPGADGAPIGPHRRGRGGGSGARPLGGQQPRPLAPARVIVVLVGEHELVSRAAQQLHAGPPVQDPDGRAAPAGIGLDQERMILDDPPRRAGPAVLARAVRRAHPVGPVAERGHVKREERDRHLRERAARVPAHPLGQERHASRRSHRPAPARAAPARRTPA